MFRNMVTSLMIHGRVRTTTAKARELRRFADRVLTLGARAAPSSLAGLEGEDLATAKARRLHRIRRARRWVLDPGALHRVFEEYAERYKDRPGGYTRMYKLRPRPGDNAEMALVELVTEAYGTAADEPEAAPEVLADEEAPAAAGEAQAVAIEQQPS
jgi:large subunit ribosomal protein L17